MPHRGTAEKMQCQRCSRRSTSNGTLTVEVGQLRQPADVRRHHVSAVRTQVRVHEASKVARDVVRLAAARRLEDVGVGQESKASSQEVAERPHPLGSL
jgi:hypothetical protein